MLLSHIFCGFRLQTSLYKYVQENNKSANEVNNDSISVINTEKTGPREWAALFALRMKTRPIPFQTPATFSTNSWWSKRLICSKSLPDRNPQGSGYIPSSWLYWGDCSTTPLAVTAAALACLCATETTPSTGQQTSRIYLDLLTTWMILSTQI